MTASRPRPRQGDRDRERAHVYVDTVSDGFHAVPHGPSHFRRQHPLCGRVPALRVGINGRLGTFYLHPRLDYNMGDMVAAFYPAYARAEVEVDFPGSWLKTGTNSISFQAVPVGDKGVPDAGFEARNWTV